MRSEPSDVYVSRGWWLVGQVPNLQEKVEKGAAYLGRWGAVFLQDTG